MAKYDDICVGDEATITHKITQSDIDQFVGLTGDDNPLHVDKDYAKTTSFQVPVVHGMLTASFISTIIGKKLPGKGALWYEQNFKFLLPVRVGETIRVVAKVIAKSFALKSITLTTQVYVDENKLVIDGVAKVKIVEPLPQIKKINTTDLGAVLVTGSSRGIGAAIAEELARQGYSVIINYRQSQDIACELKQKIESEGGVAMLAQADLTNEMDIVSMFERAIDRFGKIYGVVNNAALPVDPKSFEELEWTDIQSQFDIQIKGCFNVVKVCIPHFLQNEVGCIVNIGSVASDNIPPVKWTSYTLAKSALTAFSKSLAVEYAKKNIRVNMVSPGMTYTDMSLSFPESVKAMMRLQTPNKQLAIPSQIADIVAFLFSDKARHIVGQNIRVCGGVSMV